MMHLHYAIDVEPGVLAEIVMTATMGEHLHLLVVGEEPVPAKSDGEGKIGLILSLEEGKPMCVGWAVFTRPADPMPAETDELAWSVHVDAVTLLPDPQPITQSPGGMSLWN